MPVTDIHCHWTPRRFAEAVGGDGGTGTWHTLGSDVGELHIPKFLIPPDERIAEMDEMGVDVHCLTVNAGFFKYDLDPETAATIARECNEEQSETIRGNPTRFTGLATVPMQDVPRAIAEMEHAMSELDCKGITIADHINGETLDEPKFRPFWKAVEAAGAVVFFHQCGETLVEKRTTRYGLPNTIGNLVERALTFGTLVLGGVVDEFPGLKLVLGHAGGYTAFGAARMDKGWTAGAMENMPEFDDARTYLRKAPSDYLNFFYYDCCTYTEATLRFLVDAVGSDRVMLGTDYPAPMILDDAVNWVNGLESFTAEEKQAILSTNASTLLGL